MPKVKFLELDLIARRALFHLAKEAETLTSNITAASSHVGEIWEAAAFLTDNPKGTAAHALLSERLRLGDQSGETILDCIKRAAPDYRLLGEGTDSRLDELLANLQERAVC